MVQSFGKWEKTLKSGCYFLTVFAVCATTVSSSHTHSTARTTVTRCLQRLRQPCIEEISHRRNMREGAAAVPKQQTFTKDNVVVFIEGTLFMKVVDSHKSCYSIDQPLQSITIAAQALVRAQVP
jgi:regulator of protease activity HflC (stomatin/prohibitin superfamily)